MTDACYSVQATQIREMTRHCAFIFHGRAFGNSPLACRSAALMGVMGEFWTTTDAQAGLMRLTAKVAPFLDGFLAFGVVLKRHRAGVEHLGGVRFEASEAELLGILFGQVHERGEGDVADLGLELGFPETPAVPP